LILDILSADVADDGKATKLNAFFASIQPLFLSRRDRFWGDVPCQHSFLPSITVTNANRQPVACTPSLPSGWMVSLYSPLSHTANSMNRTGMAAFSH